MARKPATYLADYAIADSLISDGVYGHSPAEMVTPILRRLDSLGWTLTRKSLIDRIRVRWLTRHG